MNRWEDGPEDVSGLRSEGIREMEVSISRRARYGGHMQMECDQGLTVTPEQYAKYFALYDGLEAAARQLYEDGTQAELDELLKAVIYYLSPCTAKIVLNLKGE